jgi:hypothetical protein
VHVSYKRNSDGNLDHSSALLDAIFFIFDVVVDARFFANVRVVSKAFNKRCQTIFDSRQCVARDARTGIVHLRDRLQSFFGISDFEVFCDILIRTRAVVSGSVILQCMTNEFYRTDLDIYVNEYEERLIVGSLEQLDVVMRFDDTQLSTYTNMNIVKVTLLFFAIFMLLVMKSYVKK